MAYWLIRVGLQVFNSRSEALDFEGAWHLPKRKNAVEQEFGDSEQVLFHRPLLQTRSCG
jgi:hypothetical protein